MTERVEPQGVRFFAWYRLFGYLWVLITIPIFFAMELYRSPISPLALMYPALLWVSWFTPHIHGPFEWKQKSPEKVFRSIRFSIIFLPAIMCFAIIVPLAGAFVTKRIDDDGWLHLVSIAWFILTAIGYFTVPMQIRSLRKRFIKAAHHWQRCYPCGYDLRGRDTDTCPECGFKNPYADPSQTPGVN